MLRDHDDSFHGELAVAVIEEVFQAGAEQIDDQDVVQTFLSKVVDVGDSSYAMLEVLLAMSTCICLNLRHPTSILYVLYSSRSWGASLFLGSCYPSTDCD